MPETCVLLLSCPDQHGIVAAVAGFVAEHNGNIVHAEQHVDPIERAFFQRVEFDLDGFDLTREQIPAALEPLLQRYRMECSLHFTGTPTRVAILASRQPHCLYDLLARWRAGEMPMDLVSVVSNHSDHADFTRQVGVPFTHLPVDPSTRADQEERLVEHLAALDVELVILARYMQVLSPRVVREFPNRIINIHHSFLPAFAGSRPYLQAYERGVKLIGATAHYVTDDLDDGPIIEQEVARAGHRDDVASLTQKGRDLETVVLARAVRAHLERRVLVHAGRTILFA